jgi:hypothetical protein
MAGPIAIDGELAGTGRAFRRPAPVESLLLDYLVGAGEQRLRHGDAERLCGLQVDYQLELDRLLHRPVGGALSLKDLTGIDAGLGPSGGDIAP